MIILFRKITFSSYICNLRDKWKVMVWKHVLDNFNIFKVNGLKIKIIFY